MLLLLLLMVFPAVVALGDHGTTAQQTKPEFRSRMLPGAV
jgi:hypothetical protein